jgi:CHASE3 domain sensor protein
VRGGLTRRTIVASALLAILIGAAFAVLVRAIGEERDSAELATRSQQVIATANALELRLLDLETGQRGFLIAGHERFLEPWKAARAAYQAANGQLLRVTAGVADQERRAREITQAVDSYVRDYSVPLVDRARRGDAAAASAEALD